MLNFAPCGSLYSNNGKGRGGCGWCTEPFRGHRDRQRHGRAPVGAQADRHLRQPPLNGPFGSRDPDTLTTLASRLSRLNRQIDERDQQTIRDASGGKGPSDLANALLDAVDPDKVRTF
jgi:hypothetical protein